MSIAFILRKTTSNFLGRPSERMLISYVCFLKIKKIFIIYDHVSTDMSKEVFKKLCKKAWSEPRGFIVINLTSKKCNGKYRLGLDNFYLPD